MANQVLPDRKHWLTTREAAEMLGTSVRHARRLAQLLPAVRYGRDLYISRAAIEAYAVIRRAPDASYALRKRIRRYQPIARLADRSE